MTKYSHTYPKEANKPVPPVGNNANNGNSPQYGLMLYDEPDHELTPDQGTWPPTGPNIDLSSFWVMKVVGAEFITSAMRNQNWPRVFHSKNPLKKEWQNKGQAAKRMNAAGQWVYLVVFGCYMMTGYEGRALPLNASGRVGHTRHTIVEGDACVVQSHASVGDPRYPLWTGKLPIIPKGTTKRKRAAPREEKVLDSSRVEELKSDEDEPTVAAKPTAARKRVRRNEERTFPVPPQGTNVPLPPAPHKTYALPPTSTSQQNITAPILPQNTNAPTLRQNNIKPLPTTDSSWNLQYQEYLEGKLAATEKERNNLIRDVGNLEAQLQMLLQRLATEGKQ